MGPQDLLEVKVPGGGQVVLVGPEWSVFLWGGELETVSPDVVEHAERGSSWADN